MDLIGEQICKKFIIIADVLTMIRDRKRIGDILGIARLALPELVDNINDQYFRNSNYDRGTALITGLKEFTDNNGKMCSTFNKIRNMIGSSPNYSHIDTSSFPEKTESFQSVFGGKKSKKTVKKPTTKKITKKYVSKKK